MAENSYPFTNSLVRVAEWQNTIAPYGPDGVVLGENGENTALTVTADGTSMTLKVSPGGAQVRGFHYSLDATLNVVVSPNTSGKPRIDRVIVRLDRGAESMKVVRIEGAPADSPTAPALSQGVGSLWDLSLALIRVNAGAGALTSNDVTKDRTFLGLGVPHVEMPKSSGVMRQGMVSVVRNREPEQASVAMVDGGAGSPRWSVLADMGNLRGQNTVIYPPLGLGSYANLWWRLVAKDVVHITIDARNGVDFVSPDSGRFWINLPLRSFPGATQTLQGHIRNEAGYWQNYRPASLEIGPGQTRGQMWMASPDVLNDMDTVWSLPGSSDIHFTGTYIVDESSISLLESA